MRCNLEWLRQWVAIAPEDARALGERLTLAGLEVDSVSAAAPALPKVVAARVESVAAHPDAARLRLCRVDAGAGQRQVVCGAPNVREGLCAPLALEGARIGDRTIAKTVIRGVESEGMLCSGAELGLGDHSDGLFDLGDMEPGAELGEHLGADDLVYDLELTPNRADCFSIIGIAREIAALQGGALSVPETPSVAAAHENRCEVAVDAADACPRYLSRVVTGLNPAAAAPLWMRERLRRCGMRSVHPVVDVLNYVMLETGQPMHAFDRRRLAGEVRVRFAKDAESLLPIGADSADGDGAALALNRETLVIADESGPVAVAGVIGGAHSAVGADTRDIVIECAFFAPRAIAGRARALGLHTESSHRFERGVDPHLQHRALARATQLLLEIAGGAAGPVHEVESAPHLPQSGAIALRAAAVEKRLGVAVAGDFIEKTLRNLGCRMETADNGWRCVPPSWRFDLHIEEDLIEEIARFHGYDNIPEQRRPGGAPFAAAVADNGAARLRARNRRLDERLVEAGYYEVVTYSFIADDPTGLFNGETAPRLKNPISSELSVMRTSLWPGLLQVLARNLHRRRERVRIFERGPAFFIREGRPEQTQMLAGLACGALYPEQWGADGAAPRRGGGDAGPSREGRGVCGFYDVKGDIERLLRGVGDLAFEACEHPALHPGRTAAVLLDGARVGCLGQLSPAAERQLELPAAMPVLLFELETGRIAAPAPVSCKPVSPYPSVRRDIAVVFPAEVTAAAVLRCINGLKLDCLAETVVFDVFEGGDIQSGCRSMALGLIFQDLSGTLTGGASDAWVETVVAALRRDLNGQLRMTSAAAPDE